MGDELDALLHFADFLGNAGLAEFHARAGLVDQVDGFVGKEAVGDVAVGEVDGIAQSLVGVADSVEFFVALANAGDDLNGFFFIRRGHFDGLEAALE